jgi:hypothetical protein
MDGNYLPIGATVLTSIVLGCQIEDEAKLVIEALVKEYAPDVRVRQAIRAPNKYRLVVEE